MPTTVTAGDGDTLCGLAIDAGFENCQPVRDANGGKDFVTTRPLQAGDEVIIPDLRLGEEVRPVDATHTFVKKTSPPISIRFVHGSPNTPYLQDSTVTVLNISNHKTNNAGTNDDLGFPDQFEFHQPGHDDLDTFKVEVVDPKAGATLNVTLEALRRVLLPDGSFGHDVFPGAEAAKRKLDPLQCAKVRSGVAYRSKYLRLVTDENDKAAVPRQTLLVTDMTDQGDPNLEILDQQVRGTYFVQKCPAAGSPTACRVTAIADVGSDTDPRKPRARIRLAVHVVRLNPGGAPVVTVADATRRVNRWFRRIYAQAGIAPSFAKATEDVDPVSNLIAISEFDPTTPAAPAGIPANGDGQLGFRINAPGQPSQTVGPITPAAGDTPFTSAKALAALVQAPYTAKPSENPARFPDPPASQSADIVIKEAGGAAVTIDQVVSTDSGGHITVGVVNPATLQSWDGTNFLVGSIEQRALLKNYDTGSDRIDIFVVATLSSGNLGEAMMSGHQIDPNRSAIDEVKFSAFVVQSSMDGTDTDPTTMPHECGHVAMEVVHAVEVGGRHRQLMTGAPVDSVALNGTKRIREAPQLFDSPQINVGGRFVQGTFPQMQRICTDGKPLLDTF